MNNKTLCAVALVAAAIATPAFAQYAPPVRGPTYYGQSYHYGPAHGIRTFRGAYNQMPGQSPPRFLCANRDEPLR
jgi:hypothetical protein